MKKLFLLVAFTGIVGAASATSFASLTKVAIVTFKGDDKKKEEKKSCCKKDEKGKTCTGEGEKKSCCKAKAGEEKKADTAPAPKK
jgi:uncharacterized protein YfaQ (DUF2300 family)